MTDQAREYSRGFNCKLRGGLYDSSETEQWKEGWEDAYVELVVERIKDASSVDKIKQISQELKRGVE